jgi:hypothetical protein
MTALEKKIGTRNRGASKGRRQVALNLVEMKRYVRKRMSSNIVAKGSKLTWIEF